MTENLKCLRCSCNNLIIEQNLKFHHTYKCLTCNYLMPIEIEGCCRKEFLNVTIDNQNQDRLRLHRQCLNCGGCMDRTKPLSFKTYSAEIRLEFNHNLFEKWKKVRSSEFISIWEGVKENNRDTSKYTLYSNYIKSNEWKLKRIEVLTRDNNKCKVCNIKEAEEVHHITYENLFNEKLEDLLSVCKTCHKEIHLQKDKEELIEIQKKASANNILYKSNPDFT